MRGTRKSIWHDVAEQPKTDGYVLVYIDECGGVYDTVYMGWIRSWEEYIQLQNVVKWCDTSDLEDL